MDIVFLISHLPDARYKKRFDALSKQYEMCVVYWDKSGGSADDLSVYDIPRYPVNIKANRVNPFRRLPQWYKFSQEAYSLLVSIKPKSIYVGNFDMLLIAYQYKKHVLNSVKIFYEVADLHRFIVDDSISPIKVFLKRCVVSVEKRLSHVVDLLILTSQQHYDVYYYQFIEKSKVVLIPNMPQVEHFNGYERKRNGVFTVGFVGAIRYINQMKHLIEAAKIANVKVLFAGSEAGTEIKDLCKRNSDFCTYLGPYNYSKDIAKIYGQIDCVYSVYDASMPNVRYSIPNKFYEAIFCELPILVAKDTLLQNMVEKYGTGIAVEHDNVEQLTDAIIRIKTNGTLYENMSSRGKDLKSLIDINVYTKVLLSRIADIFRSSDHD